MNIIRFTPEEMEAVGDVLRNAFLSVLANFDPEYQEQINEFWRTHLKVSRPVSMVNAEGLVSYTRSVFGNDIKRDFVMQLTSTFFFMWGAENDMRLSLMKNLGSSISTDLGVYVNRPSDYRALPKETAARMVTSDEATEVLVANPWLAVMVMSVMYMSYRDFEKKPETPNKRPRPEAG